MATLESRPGTALEVVPFLREGDVLECLAGGMDPMTVVTESAKISEENWTTYYGDVPIAIWGYRRNTILGGSASVWLMTSVGVEGCRFAFAKESRKVVEDLLERYSSLEVLVHHKYRRAVNWLGWLGFVPEGSKGPFHIMRCYRGMN